MRRRSMASLTILRAENLACTCQKLVTLFAQALKLMQNKLSRITGSSMKEKLITALGQRGATSDILISHVSH